MNNKIFLGVVLLLSVSARAQENITGLINAEKSFAKYAADFNTRDAFVKYLDTSCVVFNAGKIINGYTLWKGRGVRPEKLVWGPEFAAISSSNDYGVTTGPWEYKKTLADTALARGNFTSIWHYVNGEWKNALDLGVGYNSPHPPLAEKVQTIEIKKPVSTEGNVVEKENAFIAAYKNSGKTAYKNAVVVNCWFNTEGQLPVNGMNAIEEALKNIPEGIEFTPVGFGTSVNGDFGYVYGTLSYNNKSENYLRVWIKESGEWKLLLQTLRLGAD